MNNTNRFLNRTLIFFVGVLLLLVGAGAAALLVSSVRDGWKASASSIEDAVASALNATPMVATGHSWLEAAAVLLLAVACIALVVFILRQGQGRTNTLITDATSERGETRLDSSFAESLMQDALADRPEFVSSHVSTYLVRGSAVLKVTVTCRRGVNPRQVSSTIEQLLGALDETIGRTLPVLVQISGGFRSRVSGSTRLR